MNKKIILFLVLLLLFSVLPINAIEKTGEVKSYHVLYGKIAFFIVEGLLLLMFILTIFMGSFERIKRSRSNLSTKVIRGEGSMNAIIAGFGGFAAFYTAIVYMIVFFNEYKILFYLSNNLALGYLFFFSFWFRNRIFFPLLKTIHMG
jgi:hypothetical protein